MRSVSSGKAGWKIAKSMAHFSGNKRLHRDIYTSTKAPTNDSSARHGEGSTSSAVENYVRSFRGAIESRKLAPMLNKPDHEQPANDADSDALLEQLSTALAAVLDYMLDSGVSSVDKSSSKAVDKTVDKSSSKAVDLEADLVNAWVDWCDCMGQDATETSFEEVLEAGRWYSLCSVGKAWSSTSELIGPSKGSPRLREALALGSDQEELNSLLV